MSIAIQHSYIKLYNKLDRHIQEIVQALALLYCVEARAATINFLLACQIRISPQTPTLDCYEIKQILETLYEDEILRLSKAECYYLPRSFADFVLANYCRKNTKISFYLQKIDDIFPYELPRFVRHDFFPERKVRNFRNAFFLQKELLINSARQQLTRDKFTDACAEVMQENFVPELLDNMSETEVYCIISNLCTIRIAACMSIDDILPVLSSRLNGKNKKLYKNLYAWCLLAASKIATLQQFCEAEPKLLERNYYLASSYFMQGAIKLAKQLFEEEVRHELNNSRAQNVLPSGIFGLFYCMTFIANGELLDPFFASIVNLGVKGYYGTRIYYAFKALIAYQKGALEETEKHLKRSFSSRTSAPKPKRYEYIFIAFIVSATNCVATWQDEIADDLYYLMVDGIDENYPFLGYQSYRLMKKIKPQLSEEWQEILGDMTFDPKLLEQYSTQYIDFSTLIKPESEWKKIFKVLRNISARQTAEPLANQNAKLIWLFSHSIYENRLFPIEQKRLKSGKWSKGRPVALKRLKEGNIDSMTMLDRQIVTNCITVERTGYYGQVDYKIDVEKAIPYLAKHPQLFLEASPTTPVEIIEDKVRLEVHKIENGYSITFPFPILARGIHLIKETATRYRFFKVNETHLKIAATFKDKRSFEVPELAENELKDIINGLSGLMPIHSDLASSGMTADKKIPKVKGDSTIHLHLLPLGDTIKAELFVRPFKNVGPYLKPGHGAVHVITEIKEQVKEAVRDLKCEQQNAKKIITACPTLAIQSDVNEGFNFDSPNECLEFLLEVQQIKKELVIEWPEGGKLHISRQCDLSNMKFAVRKSADWFEMNAELHIDEQQVINMYDLLNRVNETKFVELSNGEFIALTDKLKNKLLELKEFSFRSSKDKLKIHPLNVHQIDDILANDCAFKPGKLWQTQLQKIKYAEQHKPTVPSTLQAELRPYQEDGFKWLSRLAVWGVGACLADDMGLGKTVQALAVILERVQAGPILVVAPSSVCMNWLAETEKFAPSLNPLLFADGDRKNTLKNLKNFDLLITSYGLLSSEEALFAEMNWGTVVLDEAQYIKNSKAKRTKAAFSLNSEFKIITTGTPLENHLLELWTLFSFINPGLLGNKTEFTEKFANPIEKGQDKKASLALKKLIQPFLLRRNKTDVLSELPPKTEINLAIELSEQERAFYEALRRNSVATINGMKEGQQGAVHLKVLAELTKLRQACCHPSLITKQANIKSAKLDKFAEIVEELIENRHKALVFSQFVGYLHILRDFCDATGIKYQYLDGSTPMKERQKRVDAFQAGEGDIFLISLKAGGTGLNLTAADYVIHMDPWWNPAVEDQASDRTHRIGQQRPVTIYRFVAQGTVEEKIIALHQQKRELANSLLDGADMAAKMSLDDLVNLLNE